MIRKKDIKSHEDIKIFVDAFYEKVLANDTIGFIFNEIAKVSLEEHMPKMYAFWETTLFHKSTYKGNPMAVHIDLNKKTPLEKVHFDVWLHLFIETIDELFHGEKAELAKTRALSISTVMQIKISQMK